MQLPRFFGGMAASKLFGSGIRAVTLVLSALIVTLGLYGAARRWRTWTGLFTLVLLALGLLFFAWYSAITFSSRFVATLLPICGLLAAHTIAEWQTKGPRWRGQAVAVVVVGVTLGASLLMLNRVQRPIPPPNGSIDISPEARHLISRLEELTVKAEATCVITPYLGPRYAILWLFPKERIVNMPLLAGWDEFIRFAEGKNCQYLIVERDSIAERRAVFERFFDHDESGGLRMRSAPPGWRLLSENPYPLDHLIFERAREAG